MLASTPTAKGAARGPGLWRLAFWVALALECAPFWAFPRFPSQDGPSHLHNAAVLANYGSSAAYRAYYELMPPGLAGNASTQYALAGLVKLAPPRIAEELLLTAWVALFCLGFRYLAAGFGAGPEWACTAALFVPNWFLYMGFWNFVFSAALLLWALGYYVRRAGKGGSGALALWCGAGALLYMTHAVGWGICGLAAAALGWPRLAAEWRAGGRGRALWGYAAPLLALAPAGVALLLFAGRAAAPEAQVCGVVSGWGERLWPLYSLSFLQAGGGVDALVSRAAGALFAVGAAAALFHRRRPANGLLTAALLCAAASAVGPDCVGEGTYLQSRLAWFAWMFVALWLAAAAAHWPRRRSQALAAGFAALGALAVAVKGPVLRQANQGLEELAALTASIPPGATLLPVNLERPNLRVDPFLHPAGLAAPKPLVDLSNYEAAMPYFTTRFRADHSPFPALGALRELVAGPPTFHVPRYEAQTRGRVDYILFRDPSRRGPSVERQLYGAQLAAFTLQATTPSAHFRLYRRLTAPAATAPPSGGR